MLPTYVYMKQYKKEWTNFKPNFIYTHGLRNEKTMCTSFMVDNNFQIKKGTVKPMYVRTDLCIIPEVNSDDIREACGSNATAEMHLSRKICC